MNEKKTRAKLLLEHFCEYHLTLTEVKKSATVLEVTVVQECGQKTCPLPSAFCLYACPSHPCPKGK